MNFKYFRIFNNSRKGQHLRKCKKKLFSDWTHFVPVLQRTSQLHFERKCNATRNPPHHSTTVSDVNGQQCMCCGRKSCYVPMISKKCITQLFFGNWTPA